MRGSDSNLEAIDWSICTPEGSEREQLRIWSGLTIREKLNALDEMSVLASRFLAERKRLGLPYIDPESGMAVGGAGHDTRNT